LIEWNIIDTKAPNKFIVVGNMLPVWLIGQEGLEEPTAVMNLNDLPNLCQRRNARGSGGKNVIFSNGPNSTSECSKLLY
jgi:hypothetical protein